MLLFMVVNRETIGPNKNTAVINPTAAQQAVKYAEVKTENNKNDADKADTKKIAVDGENVGEKISADSKKSENVQKELFQIKTPDGVRGLGVQGVG